MKNFLRGALCTFVPLVVNGFDFDSQLKTTLATHHATGI